MSKIKLWLLVISFTIIGTFLGIEVGEYSWEQAQTFAFSEAQAQTAEDKLSEFGKDSYGGAKLDKRAVFITIFEVVSKLLSFVGIILTLIIMYAGFLWWSAGGEEDNITKAKALLRNAIIGLLIILTSYALVTLVLAPWRLPAQQDRFEAQTQGRPGT